MAEGFWSDLLALFMVGWNVDESAAELRLTRSPVEVIPMVGSHRAGRARVIEAPTSLVPEQVARLSRFEELRAISLRAGDYVRGGS